MENKENQDVEKEVKPKQEDTNKRFKVTIGDKYDLKKLIQEKGWKLKS